MACPVVHQGQGNGETVTYDNYLKVPLLLSCQQPKTKEHTELLFISVHQVFELWFKVVLKDIDDVRYRLENAQRQPERFSIPIVTELKRVLNIFKLVNQQFAILETMTPMDFMNFRGLLSPASGFQSLQFRLIEIKLGVNKGKRLKYNNEPFTAPLGDDARRQIDEAEQQPSLLDLLQTWLENTPGLSDQEFHFVDALREQVKGWMTDTHKDYSESGFENALDPALYEEARKRGERRLSHKAFLGALMTMLYREVPVFSHRYTILSLLMDIETALWQWRTSHIMMVHRMLGMKAGTGHKAEAGPTQGVPTVAGVAYLRATVAGERYRVFVDLFNISSYLVPGSFIPALPNTLKRRLDFAGGQI